MTRRLVGGPDAELVGRTSRARAATPDLKSALLAAAFFFAALLAAGLSYLTHTSARLAPIDAAADLERYSFEWMISAPGFLAVSLLTLWRAGSRRGPQRRLHRPDEDS